MKEVKENVDNGEIFHVHEQGRPDIVKIVVLPKFIYSFSAISIKILTSYFIDMDTPILKFIWKSKKQKTTPPIIVNTILKRKTKLED